MDDQGDPIDPTEDSRLEAHGVVGYCFSGDSCPSLTVAITPPSTVEDYQCHAI